MPSSRIGRMLETVSAAKPVAAAKTDALTATNLLANARMR